jgi:hypothetical protein
VPASAVMPIAADHWQVPRFPKFLIALLPIGMLIAGWGLADHLSQLGAAQQSARATITRHGTEYVTRVHTVKRVVRGHVHTLPGSQVVVHVPLIVVHTDHHVIKVPAHDVPLKSAEAAVALPNMPVTVWVTIPGPAPEPVTVTSTVTVTEQLPPVTVTVTLPLQEGDPPT